MSSIDELFTRNQDWAESMVADDPEFFSRLAAQQNPDYLWIGCADSRVPANEIVGLAPGELFVHRNVANVVVHSDLNCLSVIQYAVDVLKVEHIIVCGHYGCGGVRTALRDERCGLIDNWLRHVQDIYTKYSAMVDSPEAETARVDRLCELNVIEQVLNVCKTTVLVEAWARGQSVAVHGWIYGLSNGRLRDLRVSINGPGEVNQRYRDAVGSMASLGR